MVISPVVSTSVSVSVVLMSVSVRRAREQTDPTFLLTCPLTCTYWSGKSRHVSKKGWSGLVWSPVLTLLISLLLLVPKLH